MFGKQDKQADLEIFAIYDSKGSTYGTPQCAPNALSLIREYESQWPQMVSNGSMLASHSEDYTLFKIGEFTRRTGVLKGCNPESVVGFHEIRSGMEARAARNQPTLRDVSQ